MQRSNKLRLVIVVIVIAAVISIPFVLKWYWYFYMEADPKTRSRLPALPECYVPPGVMVDGAARATVWSWDDLNGDGVRSADEPFLQDVIVIMTRDDYPYEAKEPPPIPWSQITSRDGQLSLYEFRAGCACNCWRDVAVAAWGPSGYQATTPSLVALSKEDQVVTFGFKKVSP